MNKRRIIHVINRLGIGGAEILLLNITRNLEEYDHTVIAVEHIVRKLDFPPSVNVIEFHCSGWVNLPRAVNKLKSLIRQVGPVLVHSHLYFSSVVAKIAVPQKIPLVISLHNEMSRDLYFNKWYSFYNLIIDKLT